MFVIRFTSQSDYDRRQGNGMLRSGGERLYRCVVGDIWL